MVHKESLKISKHDTSDQGSKFPIIVLEQMNHLRAVEHNLEKKKKKNLGNNASAVDIHTTARVWPDGG